ncbi:glucosamine-6-phosphate deaminase [Helcobacillus massiliensis]|uniref:Glucosamine-6-phosphate deaminase n=1 Tax=Helcobacillus massiliensis TaxID=521392 RepID=A0A839QQK4_9MICO|nr:glucosamine-6-phosphate deaminase [Helcobacillus massiliensis]MCG7427627.1 glucosamine-6-phosphate deaminase [Helcobacillus sp. ACRRO]MBB3022604.1 glucosamine-6-phosphate deaminase [Helcobacillus massiliensis]MCT1558720.1 glucosamine-6-phosphate deaminase [Helcobacillus massiliensis]MCT2037439.1 glucosamine-6-phosphate deaminase [Helcobacillus massiliensis]MCT2332959.1 glucosamine-6-phosphate deaminase [Helcobacillus massiliensis]
MRVIIKKTPQDAARTVADQIEAVVRGAGESGATLGLATGSSPVLSYTELIRRHREEGLSFAGTRVFMLDEYVGLDADHPQSYARFIREHLTDHIDIEDSAVQSPRGDAEDPVAEAARYDAAIGAADGVDLQLLGIGTDGHIAFNEPGSSLASRTRVKVLLEQTIEDNARFFDKKEDVPVHVLTQGIGTILEARRIVLTATGSNKAEAIAQCVEGSVSSRWTGSALQMHPDVVLVIDDEAAAKLELADYYRFSEEHQLKR